MKILKNDLINFKNGSRNKFLTVELTNHSSDEDAENLPLYDFILDIIESVEFGNTFGVEHGNPFCYIGLFTIDNNEYTLTIQLNPTPPLSEAPMYS